MNWGAIVRGVLEAGKIVGKEAGKAALKSGIEAGGKLIESWLSQPKEDKPKKKGK